VPIPILLLLALPASGKSELRRYLEVLGDDGCRDLGLGPTVQLDDYPYVALMRSISRSLIGRGEGPVFFASDDLPFSDARDWLTLIHLLNEDHRSVIDGVTQPRDPGRWILERLDRARVLAGTAPLTEGLSRETVAAVTDACRSPASDIAAALTHQRCREDSTIIVEFARGGPLGTAMPLPHPHGYLASLAALSPAILDHAAALYVRVTPEQSRTKNRERARPNGEGSILHHGVPETVMHRDYGTDDFMWLLETSDRGGTISIEKDDRSFHLTSAVFDNREDLTTFLRDDPAVWPADKVSRLHARLRTALHSLQTSPT
jgi:hypothetical protein